jgi:hypothetical protein
VLRGCSLGHLSKLDGGFLDEVVLPAAPHANSAITSLRCASTWHNQVYYLEIRKTIVFISQSVSIFGSCLIYLLHLPRSIRPLTRALLTQHPKADTLGFLAPNVYQSYMTTTGSHISAADTLIGNEAILTLLGHKLRLILPRSRQQNFGHPPTNIIAAATRYHKTGY